MGAAKEALRKEVADLAAEIRLLREQLAAQQAVAPAHHCHGCHCGHSAPAGCWTCTGCGSLVWGVHVCTGLPQITWQPPFINVSGHTATITNTMGGAAALS